MATSQVHFSELKAGHWIETVQMRLLRFWEAHNVKKARRSSKPLSMTTILTHLSSEGSLYDLSAFDVARSNPKFRFGHTPSNGRSIGDHRLKTFSENMNGNIRRFPVSKQQR
ncbi:hypothetical protein Bca4012_046560 [Brassica carinata]